MSQPFLLTTFPDFQRSYITRATWIPRYTIANECYFIYRAIYTSIYNYIICYIVLRRLIQSSTAQFLHLEKCFKIPLPSLVLLEEFVQPTQSHQKRLEMIQQLLEAVSIGGTFQPWVSQNGVNCGTLSAPVSMKPSGNKLYADDSNLSKFIQAQQGKDPPPKPAAPKPKQSSPALY